MLREITKNNVLELLRKHQSRFSKYPNSQNVITLERQEWNEDSEQPDSFDVEVRFTHPNYIYLLSELYGANKNMVQDGNLGIDIFSLVARLKIIVKQLEDDQYLKIYTQKCSFHTERENLPQSQEEADHLDEIAAEYQMRGLVYKNYIDAEKRFSAQEHQALGVAIILTTKGQNPYLYLKEKFFSEPVGSFSILVSFVAVVVSIFALLK